MTPPNQTPTQQQAKIKDSILAAIPAGARYQDLIVVLAELLAMFAKRLDRKETHPQ